jgi:hypothetical protein
MIVASSIFNVVANVASGRATVPVVFVSPTGSDSAPGTLSQPLRSLPAAAEAGAGGKVWLRGNAGPFRVHDAVDALSLTGAHNGTQFSCYDPQCYVAGSAALPLLSKWSKSSDVRLPHSSIGHVLELDLRVTLPEAVDKLGSVGAAGDHAALSLSGKPPLWLARWPNLDPANMLTPQWVRNVKQPSPPVDCYAVMKNPSASVGESCVVVDGEVAARAQTHWSAAAARGELTLKGFWRYLWRDDVVPNVTVEPYHVNGSSAVLLSRRDGKPMGIYGAPPNASRFFALNVLEEYVSGRLPATPHDTSWSLPISHWLALPLSRPLPVTLLRRHALPLLAYTCLLIDRTQLDSPPGWMRPASTTLIGKRPGCTSSHRTARAIRTGPSSRCWSSIPS